MKKPYSFFFLLLLCGAVLSGCGGPKLPETYSAGEESLPSLTALVTLDKTPQCAEQTQGDTTSYCYTELDAPVQAVTDYRSALETDYDCVPLPADGARLARDRDALRPGGADPGPGERKRPFPAGPRLGRSLLHGDPLL